MDTQLHNNSLGVAVESCALLMQRCKLYPHTITVNNCKLILRTVG